MRLIISPDERPAATDAESLFDQLAAFGTEEISLKQIKAVLGSAPSQQVQSLVNACWLKTCLRVCVPSMACWMKELTRARSLSRLLTSQALAYILAGTEDDLALGDDLTGLRAMTRRYPTAMRGNQRTSATNDAAAGIRMPRGRIYRSS